MVTVEDVLVRLVLLDVREVEVLRCPLKATLNPKPPQMSVLETCLDKEAT